MSGGGPTGEGCRHDVEDCSPAYLCDGCVQDLLSGAYGIDVRAELVRVRDAAIAALAALDDEHEGHLRAAAVKLHCHAGNILHVVAAW